MRPQISVTVMQFEDCENLIRRMLTLDPKKRATIEQIKKHRWMQYDQGKWKDAQSFATHNDASEPQHQILKLMQSLGIDSNRTVQVCRLIVSFVC